MNYKIINRIIVLIVLLIVALPININAQTIKEFEDEVAKYTAQLQEKKDKIAKNEQEVAQIKQEIANIESQIKVAEEAISKLTKEIDESNKKIEEKREQSKKIMKYFQVVDGENSYLEYIFEADSVTDMIYRVSVVEQLAQYNQQIIKELKELIEENNKKKEELTAKRTELDGLKKKLQEQKERIDADTANLRTAMPGLEDQIKSAKENLKYYKSLGCGTTEDILRCQYRISQRSSGGSSGGASIPSVGQFSRPMEYGYLTQTYGKTSFNSFHMGVDFSSSNKTIPIYPIATGQLYFVGYDIYGALMVTLRHNYNGGYIYSTYAHLSRFSPAVSGYVSSNISSSITNGPIISSNTQIGNMGSTGYSTGPHLHMEITSCSWHRGGGCTWAQYQQHTISPYSLINIPSSWSNR